MTVAVSGASGLVGRAFVSFMENHGHTVRQMVRSTPVVSPQLSSQEQNHIIRWHPDHGVYDISMLEGVDAVVHLAGENIGAGRWNATRKKAILSSRVEGTQKLSQSLASLKSPPRVLLSASAVGYYGDRGEEELTETSQPGAGFLADVCQAWEEATEPAQIAGIRVVHLRTGMVLANDGGALPRLVLPFKLGLGGVIGSGNQYMSWVHLDDLTAAMLHCLQDKAIQGPVNAVTANETNRDFTATLATVLRRPAFLPLPAFAVKLLLGEMGEALLLAGQRVSPEKLHTTGFTYTHPNLNDALTQLLRHKAS